MGETREMTIGDCLRGNVDRGELAGAVVLLARGDTVQVQAVGLQDLASNVPMRRDTIFRILSMTKPIVAAAAMILVEERRIAPEDSVEKWLPELANRRVLRAMDAAVDDTVPARRAITLDDLLTFRLGLGAVMAPPGTYPIQAVMTELGLAPGAQPVGFGPDAFMLRIGRMPLMHQPGERWMYHTGIDILAVLIARIAGMPLGDFLAERLFVPLSMRDTGFSVPESSIDRLASCYGWDDQGRLRIWDTGRGGAYSRPPVFPNALVSTADDYLAFARMLLGSGSHKGRRILRPESVRMMIRDHITAEQKALSPFAPGFWEHHGWGYGGAVVTRSGGGPANVGSFGWMGGFSTSMLIDPVAGMTTISLAQRLMRGPGDVAIAEEVQSIAYRIFRV
jgi:CubicO group peptidase (beta-lactamase class C family)